jgi:hypothetical protein
MPGTLQGAECQFVDRPRDLLFHVLHPRGIFPRHLAHGYVDRSFCFLKGNSRWREVAFSDKITRKREEINRAIEAGGQCNLVAETIGDNKRITSADSSEEGILCNGAMASPSSLRATRLARYQSPQCRSAPPLIPRLV